MRKVIMSTCIFMLMFVNVLAQENNQTTQKKHVNSKVEIKLKSAIFTADSISNPKVYVDGELFNFDPDIIDKDQIESVFVVKGEKAKNEYNAPEGVLLITTKKSTETENVKVEISDKYDSDTSQPLMIVDGKKANRDEIQKLSPDDIESIEVLKDKTANTLYNAPQGVVIIKTKKGQK